MARKISLILSHIISKEHHWKMVLLQKWHGIIGDLHDKVRIEKIANNCLVLGVCHPVWAQELYLFSGILKQRINDALQEERIQKIRFRTVNLKSKKRFTKQVTSRNEGQIPLQKPLVVKLPPMGEVTLQQIKNEEFRKVLQDYYHRCMQAK